MAADKLCVRISLVAVFVLGVKVGMKVNRIQQKLDKRIEMKGEM